MPPEQEDIYMSPSFTSIGEFTQSAIQAAFTSNSPSRLISNSLPWSWLHSHDPVVPKLTRQSPTPPTSPSTETSPPSSDPSPPYSDPSPPYSEICLPSSYSTLPSSDSTLPSSDSTPPSSPPLGCFGYSGYSMDVNEVIDYEDEPPKASHMVEHVEFNPQKREYTRTGPVYHPQDRALRPSFPGRFHPYCNTPKIKSKYTGRVMTRSIISEEDTKFKRPINNKTTRSSLPLAIPSHPNLSPEVEDTIQKRFETLRFGSTSSSVLSPSSFKKTERTLPPDPPDLQIGTLTADFARIVYPNSPDLLHTGNQVKPPAITKSTRNTVGSKNWAIGELQAESGLLKIEKDKADMDVRKLKNMLNSFHILAQYLTLTIDKQLVTDCLFHLSTCRPLRIHAIDRGPFDEDSAFQTCLNKLAEAVGSPKPKIDQLFEDYIQSEIFARVIQVMLDGCSVDSPMPDAGPADLDLFTPKDELWLFVHTANSKLLEHLRIVMEEMKISCKGSVKSVVLSLLLDKVSERVLEERNFNHKAWRAWSLRQYERFEKNGNKLMDYQNKTFKDYGDRKGKRKAINQDVLEDGKGTDLTKVSWEEVRKFIRICQKEQEEDDEAWEEAF